MSETRGWLAVGAAVFFGACRLAPMSPVGTSRSGPALRGTEANAAPEVTSPVPRDFRVTLAKVNAERLLAQGHAGGRFDANIYVTPAAKDVAFAPVGKIEAGTVLVMEEIEHGKEGSGPVLMMEKMAPGFAAAHGDWRYSVADGKAVAVGPLESCTTCHDEAPHDHVFRIDE